MEVNASLVPCRRSESDDILFNFLILDAPSPSSLPAYVKLLQKHKVSHLVRVCGPTYNSELLEKNGIQVHGWMFEDGAPPPQPVVDGWLDLLEQEAGKLTDIAYAAPPTIGVHCVAGLGRAPILVALALVEYGNMAPLDAVGYVRERRNGAINQVQLYWLMKYRPRNPGRPSAGELTCTRCLLM
eukprot:gene7080-5016_t